MTKEKILEYLQAGGYICHSSENRRATVYDDKNKFVCECPVATMDRMAKADGMTKWIAMWGGVYVSHYQGKRYQNHENREHCKRIADNIDDYANGRVVKCPECGELITVDDDITHYRCPGCGYTDDIRDYDAQTIYDYFNDCLDTEYRCDGHKEYRSVQVMVAWGGPNIYIDTGSCNVKLYWGGEQETWPLSSEAIAAVDEWAEEYWNL